MCVHFKWTTDVMATLFSTLAIYSLCAYIAKKLLSLPTSELSCSILPWRPLFFLDFNLHFTFYGDCFYNILYNCLCIIFFSVKNVWFGKFFPYPAYNRVGKRNLVFTLRSLLTALFLGHCELHVEWRNSSPRFVLIADRGKDLISQSANWNNL